VALEWNGREIARRIDAAQRIGINRTVSDAIVYAKRNHEWNNQTGTLEGSIQFAEYAHRVRDGWRAIWGSLDVSYALAMELGFDGVQQVKAHTRRTKGGQASVRAHSRTVRRRPMPFLVPAADAIYPDLAGNIADAAREQGIQR
jgi:hypothetical protein